MTAQELKLKAIDITLQLVQSNQIQLKTETATNPGAVIDNRFNISDLIAAKLNPPPSPQNQIAGIALGTVLNQTNSL